MNGNSRRGPRSIPLSERCGAALGSLALSLPTGAFVIWLLDYMSADAALPWRSLFWFASGISGVAFASPRLAAALLGTLWEGLVGLLKHGP